MNLDGFKEINDEYGHQLVDEVLIEFAKKLLMVFKNDIATRYGGDEFVVFTKKYQNDKSIVKLLKEPIKINGMDLQISYSIGIANYPKDGKTIKELLFNADLAMYQAKQNKTKYCFYQK